MEKPKRKLFVITGPSGVGKTTLVDALLSSSKKCARVITCTTRAPRKGEQEGKQYRFLSREDFLGKIKRDEFFEHAEVYGNYYGALNEDVEEMLSSGKYVLMSVDVQGASSIKKRNPWVKVIFIAPPSIGELRKRLEKRAKDSKESIDARIAVAEHEMKHKKDADFVVVNDVLEKAISDTKKIVFAE